MNMREYQDEVRRVSKRPIDAYPEIVQRAYFRLYAEPCEDLLRIFDVLIWGQGIAGEAGEVCDLIKKVHGHGTPFDGEKLKKELGDVLWYVAALADAHGFTLADVAEANAAKLRARHPNGFTVATANAKADETPARYVASQVAGYDANGSPVTDGPCPDCVEDVCSRHYMEHIK